jgi:chromosome segregation ATPase
MLSRTPTEELKVINAQLHAATEYIAQVANRLEYAQSQHLPQEDLLIQLKAKFTQLQRHYSDLEQRIHNLIPFS